MTMARRKFGKLKSLLFENGYTHADLVPVIGRETAYISLRMNAKKPWNTDEIRQIAAFLDIPRDEWLDYFIEDCKPVRGRAV